ncbi:unnamed protein product [Adineta steineri]|uniref:RNA helicase n=3 Tax=Adineta steineri TaxID=433720 RepID=A0A814QMA1_9BILA|nr:unnamed protein product [Adineta steineri]CAF1121579.1 unnamed protein product [Adineta steineri]CAF3716180.1 unnamed protein product [Adineta steineri]
MNEESWDDNEGTTVKPFEQQSTTSKLGIGRGKLAFPSNSNETAPVSKWNGGGGSAPSTSGSFNTFRSNNDENSNPNGSSGGFGSRNTGNTFGARAGQSTFGSNSNGSAGGGGGAFRSSNDGNSRACYNCNQSGHMSRECPEPQKERGGGGSRGGRGGGFNSGGGGFSSGSAGGDRGSGFRPSTNNATNTFSNMRNQNNNDQGDSSEVKPTFSGWRGGAATNDSDEASKRPAFGSSTTRGSFTSSGGGFRGGRGGGGGGFNSGDRDNGGGARNDNCFNCNQPGHQSRDCPEPKKPREFGGGGGGGANNGNCFNCNQPGHQSRDCPEPKKPREFGGGGGRRNDNVSDDIFDQPAGRDGAPTVERYVPPPPPTSEADIFGEAATKGENFGKYHRTQARCTPEGRVKAIELYEEANLGTQVLSNIRRAHFEEPTPIQRYALPCIRQQDDLMACAQTGSGKTAAFLLPIISNLLEYHADELAERFHPPAPFCLIVSPTRELALQTEREARKFAFQTPVIPCSAVGGHDMFTVTDRLREGCHILSATTGRLKDMVEKGRISLKKVKYFVLDEADRMLDTGFEPDIRKLEDLGLAQKGERVTSMFSATFPDEVQRLAKHFLRDNYVFLAVGILGGANEDISQTIELVPQSNKKDRLFQLLEENLKSERCLIFVETKRSADYIGALLSQRQFMSTTMHGDRTQRQRFEAVQQFTNGKCPILVATSVAARGLDFPLIGYVVNYDLPDTSDFYIHRIGRTGRAGHLGKSISFFDPDRESDRTIAPELVQKLSEAGQDVPEFLKQHMPNTSGLKSGFVGRNADMRSGGFNHSQTVSTSGGTASAGAAEDWD